MAKLESAVFLSQSIMLIAAALSTCFFLCLSCGLRTYVSCVNNKPDIHQSVRTLAKEVQHLIAVSLYMALLLSVFWGKNKTKHDLITEVWLNLFHFVNGCLFFFLLLKPQCDCKCKGKHTVCCEGWLKKRSFPRFPLWTSILIKTTCA